MANQTGIAITIKAWLPTGKTLDEQFAALSIVKTAHETGDYAPLLKASKIEAVQTEQKTRRMDDQPQQPASDQGTAQGSGQQPGDDKPKTEDQGGSGLDGIVPQTEALKQQAKKNVA